jgi:hypothetical protein
VRRLGATGLTAVSTALSTTALLLIPTVAHACPVCFDANAANRVAFYLTTALLTLLPLAMLGGLGFVFIRRERRR